MGTENVVIIGSGPAAWSAAIYAARAELRPLVFEGAITEENRIAGTLPLGQLTLTTEVENYAGFPAGNLEGYLDSAIDPAVRQTMPPHGKHGVSGPELMELMRQQAKNFGTRIVTDDIVKVDFKRHPFLLTASSGDVTQALTVIVATGARANYLGLPSEEAYKNRGVSACAVCDGALPRFRNKPLVVVGGGDSAVEEATYLTKFASRRVPGPPPRPAAGLEDHGRAGRAESRRSTSSGTTRSTKCWATTKNGVTGVLLESTVDGGRKQLAATGVFLAIGHTPNTAFLKGQLELTDKKYIKWTKPFRTYTSVPGVFAAGDVADDYYRQAITSAGTGCMAALDAERWLAARNTDALRDGCDAKR